MCFDRSDEFHQKETCEFAMALFLVPFVGKRVPIFMVIFIAVGRLLLAVRFQ